jgi:hypothetical protein
MKKLIVLLLLLAGCHSPMHSPVYTGPQPVSYETLATIHRGLQQAAFHRRYVLIEEP